MSERKMTGSRELSRRRVAAANRTVLFYLIFGIAWIVLSGLLGGYLVALEALPAFEMAKGIFFIVASAAILYFLIVRHVDHLLESERRMIRRLEILSDLAREALISTNEARFMEVTASACGAGLGAKAVLIISHEVNESRTSSVWSRDGADLTEVAAELSKILVSGDHEHRSDEPCVHELGELATEGYFSGIGFMTAARTRNFCLAALFDSEGASDPEDRSFLGAAGRILEHWLWRADKQQELERRTAELQMIVDQVPAIVWTVGADLVVTSSAGSGLALLGQRPNETVGRPIHEMVDDQTAAFFERALEGEAADYRVVFGENKFRSRVEPLKDDEGDIVGIIGVSVDVTDEEWQLERLESSERELVAKTEALEKLSMRLIEAQEQERERIARELHDEFGGIFTALAYDVAWIGERARADERLEERVDSMRKSIEGAIDRVRAVARELRPEVLDDFGLIPALEDLTQEFSDRTGIEANLSVSPDDLSVSKGVDIALYRIVQEALTNAARHSEAQRVEVRLHQVNGDLITEVRDDGKGLGEARFSEGLGLIGLKERAELIGGTLLLESFEGRGTILRVRVTGGAG